MYICMHGYAEPRHHMNECLCKVNVALLTLSKTKRFSLPFLRSTPQVYYMCMYVCMYECVCMYVYVCVHVCTSRE